MWNCPDCGASFVTAKLSHSCVKRTADDFFADKPAEGVRMSRELIAELEKLGPVILHAVKTRVAFMVEVRFGAIYRVGRTSIRGHLWLREEHASDRFEKIEKLGERDWLYHFEISATKPIDEELRRFLKLAYANGLRPEKR